MSDPSHANLYNKQGTWIDKNNWDGWTLQSASLIGDRKELHGPGGFQHKYLTTACFRLVSW